jgi:hypothetical protein
MQALQALFELFQLAIEGLAGLGQEFGQGLGVDPGCAEGGDGELLKVIGGDDGDIVFGAIFGAEALDDVVGGLVHAGVEDLDAAGFGGLARAPLPSKTATTWMPVVSWYSFSIFTMASRARAVRRACRARISGNAKITLWPSTMRTRMGIRVFERSC